MHVRLGLAAVIVSLAGCAAGRAAAPAAVAPPAAASAAPVAPPAGPVPTTGLALSVDPETAELLVDGEPRGRVADLPSAVLGLPPGIYQVSLRAPGRATWRAEVAVRSGLERIDVKLTPKDAAAR